MLQGIFLDNCILFENLNIHMYISIFGEFRCIYIQPFIQASTKGHDIQQGVFYSQVLNV